MLLRKKKYLILGNSKSKKNWKERPEHVGIAARSTQCKRIKSKEAVLPITANSSISLSCKSKRNYPSNKPDLLSLVLTEAKKKKQKY